MRFLPGKKGLRGFTLLELVVVTAIIIILTGIVLVAIDTGRASARDARRVADVQLLLITFKLYSNDYGAAPTTPQKHPVCLGLPSTETCWGGVAGNDAINAVLGEYLQDIPTDPVPGRLYNAYIYRSPGKYFDEERGMVKGGPGSYSVAWQPDDSDPSEEMCKKMGGIWGRWDIAPTNVVPPPQTSCVPGKTCRQCGILVGSIE